MKKKKAGKSDREWWGKKMEVFHLMALVVLDFCAAKK